MKAFRFPLQKALDLRQMQLQLEEAQFQRAAAVLAALDRERETLLVARASAEDEVRRAPAVPGEDLAALCAFRLHSEAEEKRIAQRRVQCEKAVAEQRGNMLEARRRLRLIERLKERRQAEWSAEAAKEMEDMASESYLARWNRDAAPGNDQ